MTLDPQQKSDSLRQRKEMTMKLSNWPPAAIKNEHPLSVLSTSVQKALEKISMNKEVCQQKKTCSKAQTTVDPETILLETTQAPTEESTNGQPLPGEPLPTNGKRRKKKKKLKPPAAHIDDPRDSKTTPPKKRGKKPKQNLVPQVKTETDSVKTEYFKTMVKVTNEEEQQQQQEEQQQKEETLSQGQKSNEKNRL